MAEREIERWVTWNGRRIPIYKGESKADVANRLKKGAQKGKETIKSKKFKNNISKKHAPNKTVKKQSGNKVDENEKLLEGDIESFMRENEAAKKKMKSNAKSYGSDFARKQAEQLDKEVEKGWITKDQAERMKAKLRSGKADPEDNKIKFLSKQDRDDYIKRQSDEFDEEVKKGWLTQEQADRLKAKMRGENPSPQKNRVKAPTINETLGNRQSATAAADRAERNASVNNYKKDMQNRAEAKEAEKANKPTEDFIKKLDKNGVAVTKDKELADKYAANKNPNFHFDVKKTKDGYEVKATKKEGSRLDTYKRQLKETQEDIKQFEDTPKSLRSPDYDKKLADLKKKENNLKKWASEEPLEYDEKAAKAFREGGFDVASPEEASKLMGRPVKKMTASERYRKSVQDLKKQARDLSDSDLDKKIKGASPKEARILQAEKDRRAKGGSNKDAGHGLREVKLANGKTMYKDQNGHWVKKEQAEKILGKKSESVETTPKKPFKRGHAINSKKPVEKKKAAGKKPASLIDVRNTKRGRELIDQLEEAEEEMRGRGLKDGDKDTWVYQKEDAVKALKKEFGYDYGKNSSTVQKKDAFEKPERWPGEDSTSYKMRVERAKRAQAEQRREKSTEELEREYDKTARAAKRGSISQDTADRRLNELETKIKAANKFKPKSREEVGKMPTAQKRSYVADASDRAFKDALKESGLKDTDLHLMSYNDYKKFESKFDDKLYEYSADLSWDTTDTKMGVHIGGNRSGIASSYRQHVDKRDWEEVSMTPSQIREHFKKNKNANAYMEDKFGYVDKADKTSLMQHQLGSKYTNHGIGSQASVAEHQVKLYRDKKGNLKLSRHTLIWD